MPSVAFVVDDDDVVRMLREAEEAVGRRLLERVAEVLEEEAEAESRPRGVSWEVRLLPDVAVQAEQWWAHFLARGTAAHGPRRAPRLVFEVDGETVFARHVSGIAADPFHERAVVGARSRVDEVLADVLRGVG